MRSRDPAGSNAPADIVLSEGPSFDRLIRQVVESLPWGVLVEDARRRVIAVNRLFCDLFLPGETPEELIGADPARLWQRAASLFDDLEGFLAETDAKVAERSATTAELVPLTNRRTVLRDYVPLAAEDAGVVAHLWIYSDVTSERRAEEQRNQVRNLDAIGRLAGGIAHDLNNALTAVMGHASLLELELAQRPDLGESVAEIQKAAQRAGALTRQLLAFGRKQVLQPRLVDPAGVVRRVQSLLGRILGDDIELIVELPEATAVVRVDALKLEHALLDVAVNARDAMPGGGRLFLSLRHEEIREGDAHGLPLPPEPGAYAILSVTDTGTGIPEEVRAKVFEPFFSTKPRHEGPGLGLATVYGFIKQSGGAVWVDSQGARGATIHIALPLLPDETSAEARGAEPAVAPVSDSEPRATILVAEDEPAVMSLLRRALEGEGHVVLAAGDGLEALDLLDRHGGAPDLLITDAVMPRMDGLELALRVRARCPSLPILLTSGYSPDVLRQIERVPGETRLIEKPFVATDVLRAVEEILGR
jgi:two-component system, cell cycle sensor histidine kinase and response regulator CckA